jgi:hypothetical protein
MIADRLGCCALVGLAGCFASACSSRTTDLGNPPAPIATAGQGATMGQSGGGGGSFNGSGGLNLQPPSGGAPAATCASTGTSDADNDGYTVADGDCNDCDLAVNPGAFDVPGNGLDEDCSGAPDDEPSACDQGLPVDGDAVALAKALGICRQAAPNATGKQRTWGLVSARFVFPDGTTASLPAAGGDGLTDCVMAGRPPANLSHGVLTGFGPNVKPREGAALAALSSGIAREGANRASDAAGQGDRSYSPSGASMCTVSRQPDGFPVSSYATCGDLDGGTSDGIGGGGGKGGGKTPPGDGGDYPVNTAFDGIALELVVRAPTNAKSFSFDFDFYTYEYSTYVCSPYNDAFVALLTSKSPDVPANHNIAFDSQKDPVCVNNGFVEVCEPFTYEGTRGNMPFTRNFTCALGTSELVGTGFGSDTSEIQGDDPENHAATGWLQTSSNIAPGEEFTLRMAVWDAGDEVLDSTVLLDRFAWALTAGATVTVRPPDIVK